MRTHTLVFLFNKMVCYGDEVKLIGTVFKLIDLTHISSRPKRYSLTNSDTKQKSRIVLNCRQFSHFYAFISGFNIMCVFLLLHDSQKKCYTLHMSRQLNMEKYKSNKLFQFLIGKATRIEKLTIPNKSAVMNSIHL